MILHQLSFCGAVAYAAVPCFTDVEPASLQPHLLVCVVLKLLRKAGHKNFGSSEVGFSFLIFCLKLPYDRQPVYKT